MKTKNYTFKKLIVIVVLLLIFNIGNAQNPIWTLPSNYLALNPSGTPSSGSLPTPTDPNNTYDSEEKFYYYQGQSAEVTHNSMVDAQGELLFFIVDEIVYDKDGYAMGWLISDANPSYQMKGSNERVIVQDPTNCSRYYIIGTGMTNYGGLSNHYPFYAILDLDLTNELFPNRKGSLAYNSDGNRLNSIADLVDIPPFDEDWGNSRMGGVYYAVSPLNDDNTYHLFVSSPQYVFKFTISSSGIHYSNSTILIDYPSLIEQNTMRAEMELKQLPTGDYFIAVPYVYLFGTATNPYQDKYYAIMVTLLNSQGIEYPNSKRIYGLEIINNETPKISGIEFSENGQYLYITHKDVSSRQSCIEYIDLAQTNYTIHPLIVDNNKGRDYQYSQLEMGVDNRIYCIKDDPMTIQGVSLASLTNTNTPSPSNWNANAIALNYQPNYMGLPPAYQNVNDRKYLLPDQIDGFDYFSIFEQNLACCINSRTANDYLEVRQNQIWTNNMQNAPFMIDNGIVYVKHELRIKAGSVLTIEGMEFRFSPNAKVIVERSSGGLNGAKLILKNTTFTVDTRCSDNLMWPGVEVYGYPNLSHGFPNSSSFSHNTPHGAIYVLANSRIEHAKNGITTGRVFGPNNTVDPQFSGGMVGVDQSTFYNNEVDVQFAFYPQLNRSYFHRSTFVTNGLLNDVTLTPRFHLGLFGVDNINIKGCTFVNETPTVYAANQQGIGIASINSRFFVDAFCGILTNCPNPIRSVFHDLTDGVIAMGFPNSMPFTVDRSDFLNNHTGIYASNVNNFRIQRNVFEVYKSVAPNYTFETRGIHILNSTGYIVQENNFYESTQSGISGQGETVGVLVDNSGTADNEIYKNSFRNLKVGGKSLRTNSVPYVFSSNYPNNQGLRWKCNNFAQDMYQADLGVASGRIAYQQGYCLPLGHPLAARTPAGNSFSQSTNTSANDFWANPGVLPFNYAHHADAVMIPTSYTASVVMPQHCSPNGNVFSNSRSCPTRIRSGIIGVPIGSIVSALKSEIFELEQSIEDKEERLNEGSSAALLNMIANTAISHGDRKNALIAASPLLSDEVLVAYVLSTPPAGHLPQVISANSPVSPTVWSEIEALSIPRGIKRQLENLQQGVSERTYLVNELGYEKTERSVLVNELLATYWMDTTLTDAKENIKLILENEHTGAELHRTMVEYYLKIHAIDQAQSSLDAYIALAGYDEFVKLAQYAIASSPVNCLFKGVKEDSHKRDEIKDIADNMPESRYCSSAQTLLEYALNESYERYTEPLIMSMSMMQQLNSNTAENNITTDENVVQIFPNPASSEFFVVLDLPSEDLNTVTVDLYTLTGQKVNSVNTTDRLQLINMDVSHLSEGMYLVIVTVGGEELSRQKVAVK